MDHADPAETLQPGLDQVGVDLLLTRYMPAASDPCTGESSTLTSCHQKVRSVVVFWCTNTTMAENDEKRNSVAAALQNASSTGTAARVGAGKRRRHAKRRQVERVPTRRGDPAGHERAAERIIHVLYVMNNLRTITTTTKATVYRGV